MKFALSERRLRIFMPEQEVHRHADLLVALLFFGCRSVALTANTVLWPVVINPAHFRVRTCVALADTTATAVECFRRWLWLSATMVVNWTEVNTSAAALVKRTCLELAVRVFLFHTLRAID